MIICSLGHVKRIITSLRNDLLNSDLVIIIQWKLANILAKS